MTKTTILLLILVAFAQPTFSQEVRRFDLQNTTGYNFLLKAVQPDESTLVIFRKQPSKGPGGYQVIADVINDNGVKRIVVSTPKELGMQIW